MAGSMEGGLRLRNGAREETPLISIITVVFRARQELVPILDSILRLKDQNTEWIVIDGGSKDGTIELLSEHDTQVDYWISEPDRGIYDAMNKGVSKAHGIFLLHLNAGDSLLNLPVAELRVAAERKVDVVACRVLIDGAYEFRPASGIGLRFNNTLHHQGTFFRREGFPAYDLGYKIFADFDVNQKLARRGAKIEILDRIVARHSTDGISSARRASTISEFFRVIATNQGRHYLPAAWFLCKWRGLRARLDSRRRATAA
jgi:glycosyltransferase involved in cell wall biosynthesis